MASAGRILIMPKGTYDSSTTYEMLDMVGYNGTTWLAKKTVVGIEPSDANGEYWHNFVDFDENEYANKTVLSSVNNTVDPNATSLARVRTKHTNCPTSDTEYVIDTIFVDGTDDIYEKYQYARGTGDVFYTRYKGYNAGWSLWTPVAIGGSTTINYNPSGYNYIEWTFDIGKPDNVKLFANVVGTTELYVVATNIVSYAATSVTVRFILNKAYSDIVTLRIGYIL